VIWLIGLWPHTIAELREVTLRLDAQLIDIRKDPHDRNPNYDGQRIQAAFPDRYHHIPEMGGLCVAEGVDILCSGAILERSDVIAFCTCPRANKCHRPAVAKELHRRRVPCKLTEWKDFPKPVGVRWDPEQRKEVVDGLCVLERWAAAHPDQMTDARWMKMRDVAFDYHWANCLVQVLGMTDGVTLSSVKHAATEFDTTAETLFAAIGRMEACGELQYVNERSPYNPQEYIGSWRRINDATKKEEPGRAEQAQSLSLDLF